MGILIDIVSKPLAVVVAIYSWDYIAPNPIHSRLTGETFLESAVVRFLSCTKAYLTEIIPLREEFHQQPQEFSTSVRINVPEHEPCPDVASAGSKSQPHQLFIPLESSSQPTAPELVVESWARSRLEEYADNSQHRRPVAACVKSQAETPLAYFQNNVDHVLSKQQQAKAHLRDSTRLKKHGPPPIPDTTDLRNSKEFGNQLKLAVQETSKACNSVLELSEGLMQEVDKKRKRGKPREKFVNVLANLGAKIIQKDVYFQNALHRLEEAKFVRNEDMELQEMFAHHWNTYCDILDNLINKMDKILKEKELSGQAQYMVGECKELLLRRREEAGKCGLWPDRPNPALTRTDTTTNLNAPVGGVENEDESLADTERNKKAKTGAKAHNKKRVRWRDLIDVQVKGLAGSSI